MKRSDEEMVKEALKRLDHIDSNREKGRRIGVSEGTIRRWKAGKISTPLRKETREPLEGFLAKGDADKLRRRIELVVADVMEEAAMRLREKPTPPDEGQEPDEESAVDDVLEGEEGDEPPGHLVEDPKRAEGGNGSG